MRLNKFSVFLLFISLLASMISCNVEEEDDKEVFQWEQITGFGATATTESFNSPNYNVTKSITNLKIVGYPNSTDSVVINLGNLEGDELTIGEYKFGFNSFFNLSFFKDGIVYNATSGLINVTYLNNRIDFDFDVELSNGTRLSNGLGDNLLLSNSDIGPGSGDGEPPVTEIGTIEATINGAHFLWDKSESVATFTANPGYLAINGTSSANAISMAFTEITSSGKLSTLVGQTVQLGLSSNLISYATYGGTTENYITESGQAYFSSYSDNILSISFTGMLINPLDPTVKIPVENGEVKAIFVN